MDDEGIRRRDGVRAANNLLAHLNLFEDAWIFLTCHILFVVTGISFLSVLVSAVSTDACHHQESAQKWANLAPLSLIPGKVLLFLDAENNYWMVLYPRMTDGTIEEFSCAVDLRSPIPTLCFAFLLTLALQLLELHNGQPIDKQFCFFLLMFCTALINRPSFHMPVVLMLYLVYVSGRAILVAWHRPDFPARASLYKNLCQIYNVF